MFPSPRCARHPVFKNKTKQKKTQLILIEQKRKKYNKNSENFFVYQASMLYSLALHDFPTVFAEMLLTSQNCFSSCMLRKVI